MKYQAMKKLLELSLDTMSGVFPFMKYDLKESNDGTEVTVSFAILRMDGFSAKSSQEVTVAFKEDQARFLRVVLESEKKFMSFGYDSLIQLFVFLVAFFSIYLDISIKQVLNFFFNKEMDWKEFFQFVLESNLIDSAVDHGSIFVYGIGVLEFESPQFKWTDMHFNQFSYTIDSDEEALFVISFVLGYVQAVIGHDLLVSNLVEPDDDTQDQGSMEAAGEDEMMGGEMGPDMGGMGPDLGGGGPMGGPGGPGGEFGQEGMEGDEEGLGGGPMGGAGDIGGGPMGEEEGLPEEEEPIGVPGGNR